MILYKNEQLIKTYKWKKETIYILTDFDKTITSEKSEATWNVLSQNEKVPKEYKKEEKNLYKYYRPIEKNHQIDKQEKYKLMTEWWEKSISLFIKYKLEEKTINDVIDNQKLLEFRNGAQKFLKNMNQKNIPVIIISAGLGNIIEDFLKKNKCFYNNIHIESNFIKFEKGLTVGIKGNIIHSLNKDENNLPENIKEKIKNRPNIIILGDSVDDANMTNKPALKIGFLEDKEKLEIFKQNFDIVCTSDTSFEELSEIVQVLK